jgi:predicted transcriptional regulator
MNKLMLISITPAFVEKIFAGEKKFELRKTLPKISHGVIAVIYATSPKKSLIGHFKIGKIFNEEIEKLWDSYNQNFGISQSQYQLYFNNYNKGVAIEIIEPIKWKKEISLSEIRKFKKNFNPPQSYYFITDDNPLFHFLKINI